MMTWHYSTWNSVREYLVRNSDKQIIWKYIFKICIMFIFALKLKIENRKTNET